MKKLIVRWTTKHQSFLSAPPHPSPLPFYLHRSRFLNLLTQAPPPGSTYPPALEYAHKHLLAHFAKHNEGILKLLTAYLYKSKSGSATPYEELDDPNLHAPLLIPLFTAEFCRLHGWAREEPLDVAVDLGGRGGALSMIEKGRRVMGDRLGDVRQWDELPVSLFDPYCTSILTHSDGDPSSLGTALPLCLRLSSLERSRNGDQSPKDASMWPRYCRRELEASTQGQVSLI